MGVLPTKVPVQSLEASQLGNLVPFPVKHPMKILATKSIRTPLSPLLSMAMYRRKRTLPNLILTCPKMKRS
jgi:hypothetical protein